MSTRRPRRKRHCGEVQPSSPVTSGSTHPVGSLACASSRATTPRSGSRSLASGAAPSGWRTCSLRVAKRSSQAGSTASGGRPSTRPISAARALARAGASSRAVPSAHGSASRVGSFHSDVPSASHCRSICQRGSGSPGYHLPWPRWTAPPTAYRLRRRSARSLASRRLSSPSASVFHWAEVMSSSATKVGSPPIVRRTSPASRRASTAAPSSSMRSHCASV